MSEANKPNKSEQFVKFIIEITQNYRDQKSEA